MGEHVLAVFALVYTQNKCASDRRSSDPVQVVKYGAGWYQRMSRVACRVSPVADAAAVKSRSWWQSWAKERGCVVCYVRCEQKVLFKVWQVEGELS